MSKLIAYYSRADENYFQGAYRYIRVGNTEKAANMIAKLTGGTLFKIRQKVPYAKDYDTCIAQAKKDLQEKVYPELVSLPESIDAYDEIYIGYPNYWGTMPMAVYTFLKAFDWNGKKIYPFCTHEGSGLSDTEKDIADVCKGATVKKGLAIYGSSVDNAEGTIAGWLK